MGLPDPVSAQALYKRSPFPPSFVLFLFSALLFLVLFYGLTLAPHTFYPLFSPAPSLVAPVFPHYYAPPCAMVLASRLVSLAEMALSSTAFPARKAGRQK